MMSWEIRRARTGEAAEIGRLVRNAYAIYVTRIGRHPAPVLWDYHALVAAGQVWVADSAGTVVGVVVLRPHEGVLQLENVAVAPIEQRQGIGRGLIAFAEQRARELGLSAVTLYTHERMEENQRLYLALGYEETGRGTEDVFSRVYFRKRVGQSAAEDPRVLPLALAELTLPSSERWPPGKPFPIVAHAVTHRDGVFLFDTGIGTGNPEVEELVSPRRRPLDQALAEHGIAMADVTAVGNCHLHADHGGQNGLFPGRPIFVQHSEWAKVHEPDYTIPEWIDVPGLAYELLDGDAEVAPGLRVIATPGHTPGHQSLVVETATGPVLVTGQAVEQLTEWNGATDEMDSGVPALGQDGRDDYIASVERLRSINPVRVHFVHDTSIWQGTP
jgi:N-acyl homoserine lactone hydrolase